LSQLCHLEENFSNPFAPCIFSIFTSIFISQCNTLEIVWFDDGLYVYLQLFNFDPSSFEDFSNVVVFLELHDNGLPFEPIDLFEVQAFVDVVIDQPSCPSFIVFQPTCPIVIVGQTSCSRPNVVVG
jgi:hypothetical protein